MLLRTGKRLKRASISDDDDDGLPLSDEMLLVIFASYLNTDDDLVRCAATCRRWRRIVSSEASFICRSDTPRFVPVGFFHQDEEYGVCTVPCFSPMAPHFPRAASANALFAGEASGSSRLVTSRKGRLVLELPGASLRLVVCNPMTGDVTVLPELSGKDKPGRYVCALLTADDAEEDTSLRSPSSFRLVTVYDRRDFTACRAYSSESAAWGQEGKLSGARVSGRSLAQAHAAAIVSHGAVFWRVRDAVLALRLDGTLEATLEPLPKDWTRRYGAPGVETRVLAVSPDDGRLCVVEAGTRYDSFSRNFEVRVVFREQSGGSDGVAASGKKWNEWASRWDILKLQPPSSCCCGHLTRVCTRGVCEKSGVVFLAARFEATGGRNCEALYALDVGKMKARLLRGIPDPDVGSWCRFGSRASFHGYEMDRVAYITALGKRDGNGNINITTDEGDIYDL